MEKHGTDSEDVFLSNALESSTQEKPHDHRDIRIGEQDDSDLYPKGMALFMLTLGIMGVVLMVALDNYILGLS